jgi:hypothetical protein
MLFPYKSKYLSLTTIHYEQSSSKPVSHFDINKISHKLQNMKVHYCVDQSQLLESILSKINPAHTGKLFL